MKSLKIASALSFILCSTALADGGVSSGGGAFTTYQNNPWFVGRTQATYCVDWHSTFSRDRESAVATIQKAVTAWTTALPKFFPGTTRFPLLDGQTKALTQELVFQPQCGSSTDLRIYLGNMPAEVATVLGQDQSAYIALTHRTSYRLETGWSQGFMWLMPDLAQGMPSQGHALWDRDEYALYLVALHELGHVFGFQHDRGAFMAEDFPQKVLQGTLSGKGWHGGFPSPEIFIPYADGYIFKASARGRICSGSVLQGLGDPEIRHEQLRNPEEFFSQLFGLSVEQVRNLLSSKFCLGKGEHDWELQLVSVTSPDTLTVTANRPIPLVFGHAMYKAPDQGIMGTYATSDAKQPLKTGFFISFFNWDIPEGGKIKTSSGETISYAVQADTSWGMIFDYKGTIVTMDLSPKWE